MKRYRGVITALFLSIVAAQQSGAATVVVTPPDIGAYPSWIKEEVGGGGADINTTYPRNGDGSLQLTGIGSPSKANLVLFWDPNSTSNPFGVETRLSDLTSFSYEWYRDSSSTNPNVQTPALKIGVWTDLNNDGGGWLFDPDENATLIYEPVYSKLPGPAPTDQWVYEDASTGKVWQYHNGVIEKYDWTIADWLSGATQPVGSLPINENTKAFGAGVGVGSGFVGEYIMAADSITLGFEGGNTLTHNMEAAAVPEASSMALIPLAALGLLRRRRY